MATLPLEPPLPWLWSCHHCHARYPLGTTRRCLHDGHYFCGGTTISALTGKTIKRHKACGSEFDYVGWEDVARWRRSLLDTKLDIAEGLRRKRGCENSCEYPSACHHRGGHRTVRKSSRAGIEELFAVSQVSANNSVATNAAGFEAFLDPSFFEKENSPPAPEAAELEVLSTFPTPKKTGLMIKKMIKAARRNSQTATLRSTAEEEMAEDALRPTRSAPPRPLSSAPPTLFTATEPVGAMASAKELGLVIPSLDFSPNLPSFFSPDSSSSSSEASFSEAASSDTPSEDEEDPSPTISINKNPILPRKKPHIDLRLDEMDSPPDIDMTDYIPESPTSPTSPGFPALFIATDAGNLGGLLTPKSPDSPTNPLFRRKDMPSGGERTPPSPPSPRRNAWDWSAGNGKAGFGDTPVVSTPAKAASEDVEMDLGMGMGLGPRWDMSLLVDDMESDAGAGIGPVDRRVSV